MRTLSALALLALAGVAPADTIRITIRQQRPVAVQQTPVLVPRAAPVYVQRAPVFLAPAPVGYAPRSFAPLAAPDHCLDPVTAAQLRQLQRLGY